MLIRTWSVLFLLTIVCVFFQLAHSVPQFRNSATPFREITIDQNQGSLGNNLGDLDGDGYLDIAGGDQNNNIYWYQYPSWRKFTIATDGGGDDLQIADVNSDGAPDIVTNGKIAWYENPRGKDGHAQGLWTEHVIDAATKSRETVIRDLNGDGRPDIIIRTELGLTYYYLQENTPQAWTRVLIPNAPPGQAGLAIGDINRDGLLDIVENGFWLEAPADYVNGTWAEHDIVTWTLGTSVAVYDINHDGRLDIFLAASEGTPDALAWFEAPADPISGNWIRHDIDTVQDVHRLYLIDVNKDGTEDLVFAEMDQSATRRVGVYYNGGLGMSWNLQVLSTGRPYNIAVGDIGNDGDVDILGAVWSTSVRDLGAQKIWLNDLSNSRTRSNWTSVPLEGTRTDGALGAAFGDLDNDGRPDIISGEHWYKNPGKIDGSWVRTGFGAGYQAMLTMDVDGDGRLDVIAQSPAADNVGIYWLKPANISATTWIRTLVGSIPGVSRDANSQGYAIAKLNVGGKPQIIFSNNTGYYYLTIPSNPSAGHWPQVRISADGTQQGLAAGDVDGDGVIDGVGFSHASIQGQGLEVNWWRNPGTGAGNWTKHFVGTTARERDRIRIADINGDGRSDIVVTDSDYYGLGDLYWFEQQLNDVWVKHVIGANLGSLASMDVGDFNKDGKIDVVVGEHQNTAASHVFVYENVGGGDSWIRRVVDYGKDSYAGTLAVDLDTDGDLDIVTFGDNTNQSVHLWRNDTIAFAPTTTEPAIRGLSASPDSSGSSSLSATSSVTETIAAQSAIYGLDFPGSAAVASTMRFRFLNPLSIYPATYIWRAYPRRQPSYFTTFFWGNDDGHNNITTFTWDNGVPNSFYGAHPYPISGTHKWEIATDQGVDWLSSQDVQWNRWYTQAFVAWADSRGYKHTLFYWDLPDTTKVIDYSTEFGSGANYGNKQPPVPALTFGDAPWNPGNEVYNGILRGIRVYSTNLSLADIQSEANSPISSSAGAANIWYLNMDPTPTDISDKSGRGHNPSWVGSERPSLYTDSTGADTTPPSVPTNLSATAVSSSQINLSWTASTDNVAVAGYKIYSGSIQVGTSTAGSFSDSGLSAGTTYAYRVSAFDAAGNESAQSSSASATTLSSNQPPTASFTATPTSGAAPLAVSFNAGASSDPDGDTLTYTWNFGDGSPAGAGASVNHTYQSSGSYISNLTVNDGRGGTATASRTITVGTPPVGVHINFQPAGTAYPGYLVDSGSLFGARGNGYTYGWNVDASMETRNRNNALSPDARYDTLIHMGNAVWEIAVPNGSYAVHVVVGDPSFNDVVSKLTVEGLLAINGTTGNSTPWLEATVMVSVNDGRLTVGNQAGSFNKICYIDISAPTSDTTPPVISGASASGVTSTSATITWTTNEASDSQVEYGTTSSYGSSTTLNSSMVTAHSQVLSGLTANTTYHFRVKSKDAAGNLATSGDFTFTTIAPVPSPSSININFQPAGTAFPGYLVDSGLIYGARGNGQTYGWNVSVAADTRDRNSTLSRDERYDTLAHMGNAVWEIALPNGSYTVHVVVGDPSFDDVISKLTVEGVLAINGTTSSSNRWLEATVTVSVTDGRLTIGNLAGSWNKICYIDISAP